MINIQALLRSRIVWTAIVLLSFYWIIAAYFVPYSWMAEIVNAVRLVLALLVMFVYGSVAYEALTSRKMKNTHHLVLGIMMTMGSIIAIAVWSGMGRLLDFDTGISENKVTGFWIWCMVLGQVLHLTAPSAVDDAVPIKRWGMVAVGVVAGIIIGAVIASAFWQASKVIP